VASYGQRFQSLFPYPGDYPTDKQQSLEAFSKAITSNLVAGVGYFYGTSIINRKFSYEWDEDEDAVQPSAAKEEDEGSSITGAKLTEPKGLLTATPSRSFFPRGFYW
jgi:mannosyl-oligosaccharide glucosidase